MRQGTSPQVALLLFRISALVKPDSQERPWYLLHRSSVSVENFQMLNSEIVIIVNGLSYKGHAAIFFTSLPKNN